MPAYSVVEALDVIEHIGTTGGLQPGVRVFTYRDMFDLGYVFLK